MKGRFGNEVWGVPKEGAGHWGFKNGRPKPFHRRSSLENEWLTFCLFLCCRFANLQMTMGQERSVVDKAPENRPRSPLCDNCKGKLASAYCEVEAAYFCTHCDSILHGASRTASRHERISIKGPILPDFVINESKKSPLTNTHQASATGQNMVGKFAAKTSEGHEGIPAMWMDTEPSSTTSGEAGLATGLGAMLDGFGNDFVPFFEVDNLAPTSPPYFPQKEKPPIMHGSSSPVAHTSRDNSRSPSPGMPRSPTATAPARSFSPEAQNPQAVESLGKTKTSSAMHTASGLRHTAALQPKSTGMKRIASTPALSSLQTARQDTLSFEGSEGAAAAAVNPTRAAQLQRYRHKRFLRLQAAMSGRKKIRYACRKTLADNRPRVKGRFAKVNEPVSGDPPEKRQGSASSSLGGAKKKTSTMTTSKIPEGRPVNQGTTCIGSREHTPATEPKETLDQLMLEESRDVLAPLATNSGGSDSMDRARGFSPELDNGPFGWLFNDNPLGDEGGFSMPSGSAMKRCFSDGALLSLDIDDLIPEDFVRDELNFQEGLMGENGL